MDNTQIKSSNVHYDYYYKVLKPRLFPISFRKGDIPDKPNS